MFNRILVPLDGSTLAERAIPHAEQFARIFGSSIILLQVLDPTSYHENPNPVDPLSWQIRKAEADMYMQGIAARIREDLQESMRRQRCTRPGQRRKKMTGLNIQFGKGKRRKTLSTLPTAENIDLLVISTHGSGGLSRWNISSVTQKVINLIYLPVLIVRAYHQPATADQQGPLPPHSPPDRQFAPRRVFPFRRNCPGTWRNIHGSWPLRSDDRFESSHRAGDLIYLQQSSSSPP